MSVLARWLRNLADTIDPQLPPTQMGTGLPGTEYRERLCQWVRDNGLNPNDIPEDADIEVGQGTITTEVIMRDPLGKPVVDGNRVVCRTVTVPLVKRWSDVTSASA